MEFVAAKTTIMILAFCRALERLTFDSVNIAFAESIALARAILGEGGNGLGIKNYFGEAAREGQYKGKRRIIHKNSQLHTYCGVYWFQSK